MGKCAYCGSIIFGGVKHNDKRFCNIACRDKALMPSYLEQAPAEAVEKYIEEVHSGHCPICGGPGPVDVYISYRVWSALVVTHREKTPRISCKSCGKKEKLSAALFSFFFGWWGFPWGFIFTPAGIYWNLSNLSESPDPSKPSPHLIALLEEKMATEIMWAKRREANKHAEG